MDMAGVLILVVGPSGVGKDTLLAGAQAALEGAQFVFPCRTITRPEDAGGETHIAASTEAFAAMKANHAFTLSWSAHGLDYGVPVSICDDMAAGRHVVVNVSRTVIGEARERFERVGVVAVSAPRTVLQTRLEARGREDAEAVSARLDRVVAESVTGDDVIHVVNDGTVDQGIAEFVAAIRTLSKG